MNSRRISHAVGIAILTLVHCPGHGAGQVSPFEPGEELRIYWQSPSAYGYLPAATVGDVVDFSGGHIMLQKGHRMVTVPLASVRSIGRRVGTRPASAPAMVAGSAGGFAAGFVVGAFTGGINGSAAGFDRVDAGLTTGVLIGAPLGAFTAWLASRSRGIYEDVPFSDMVRAIAVDPRGAISVSLKAGGT
jgi:hypothetical protein